MSARHVVTGLALALLLSLLAACGGGDAPTAPANTAPPAETNSAQGYFEAGNAHFQSGNFSQAEAAYRQAIALDPTNPAFHANLGVTLYSQGRLGEAEQSYQAGLKLAPNDADLHYLLGATYLQQDRLTEAETELRAANQLDPTLAEPYYGLGALYKLQGRTADAIRAFERFLEIGPSQDQSAIQQAQQELDALRAGQ